MVRNLSDIHQCMDNTNSKGNFSDMEPNVMGDIAIMEETIVKVKRPSEYAIIIYNDDITPFEVVLVVLISIFSKNEEEAVNITKEANDNGQAIIGTYSYDVAKTLLDEAHNFIKEFTQAFNFIIPLRIEMKEV